MGTSERLIIKHEQLGVMILLCFRPDTLNRNVAGRNTYWGCFRGIMMRPLAHVLSAIATLQSAEGPGIG